MKSRVMVVSVHPDDEVLGAGGALLRHRDRGDEIHWLILTTLAGAKGSVQEAVDKRRKEVASVAKQLGVASTTWLDYPTMTLSGATLPDLVPSINRVFQSSQPETLYLVNRSDAHSDHRVAFEAVIACTKSFRSPFLRRVFMYECISETEFAPALHEKAFLPNYFVDITGRLDEKLALIQLYESEIGVHPFPRSLRNIEALATFRGAMAGVEHAEAFQLIKWIDK